MKGGSDDKFKNNTAEHFFPFLKMSLELIQTLLTKLCGLLECSFHIQLAKLFFSSVRRFHLKSSKAGSMSRNSKNTEVAVTAVTITFNDETIENVARTSFSNSF